MSDTGMVRMPRSLNMMGMMPMQKKQRIKMEKIHEETLKNLERRFPKGFTFPTDKGSFNYAPMGKGEMPMRNFEPKKKTRFIMS